MLHQGGVLGVRDIAGVENIVGIPGLGVIAEGAQILAARDHKGLVGVAAGDLADPFEVLVLRQTAERVIILPFYNAGHLVKDALVGGNALHVLPAVVGDADLVQRNAQLFADEAALVVADGEHPLCEPFGGQAVYPELEAEKALVGIHDERADVVQHHNTALCQQHIAGKADIKGVGAAQISGQYGQIVEIFDGLERHKPDVFQLRQVDGAAVVPVGDADIQTGALDELVQTHHSFIDIARDAGDVVAQHRAVDDDGVQSSSSFSQWEQSSSSCCQSAMRRSQYSFSSRSKRSSLKERLCSRISSLE